VSAAILILPPLLFSQTLPQTEYDDCDAHFIAYVGSDAYQFSPLLPGELGLVRLFSVLSYERAAARRDLGRVFWKLEIRGPDSSQEVVRTASGWTRFEERGRVLAEFFWDGRDETGQPVEPGRYGYTFSGRYLADLLRPAKRIRGYDDLVGFAGADEAYASTDEIIVDYGLDAATARGIRASLALSSCQAQQNAPIEPGFPYNFYYGSTHSHSNFSDGGQPTASCSTGAAYGSGNFDPAAVYDYARNTAGLDYWVVNEHNHLLNDAVSRNDPPVTEAKVLQKYADGLTSAAAATASGSFVALYGLEWGVTTNTDQGHVTLLETPRLFGWETCSSCNGPDPECSPGTNCYFEVFTPKRFGYLTLYQRSVENPSPVGPLGILCHPRSGEFDNYAFDANADAALQGIAVRSGLAFSAAEDCSDANVASTDYSGRWRAALNLGFHLGPVADHDAHCNNYGVGLPTRTVYLLPNAASPALTKTAFLDAHKARHFFASEDSNAQLVFATSDNSRVMGDIFDAAGSVTLRASVSDPNDEAVSALELWRGQVGGGIPTAPYASVSGQPSLTVTESLCSGTYYYYVHAVQSDGHDLWSSPMWITFSGTGCGLDLSGWRVNQQNAAYNFMLPSGTAIPANGYVVIGRNATKSAFEAFWLGGAELPSNVVYINAAGAFPVINGDEYYTLYDASETEADGPTIAMPSSAGRTVQRLDPCLPAGESGSWTISAYGAATPGSGAAAGCGRGIVINEFADPTGTGNFVYEFIELHFDNCLNSSSRYTRSEWILS